MYIQTQLWMAHLKIQSTYVVSIYGALSNLRGYLHHSFEIASTRHNSKYF